jgi:hypothetical protein
MACCAVIAIRGTLSFEDCVTDFMCEPAEMDDWLNAAGTSHSGRLDNLHDPKGLVGSSKGMGFSFIPFLHKAGEASVLHKRSAL